ncbi:MAG TPA: nicotinamide-nucleotide amidohydrolase family protein [Candidatus Corynebacterium avicola]|uniref:Nicotinamide-nucleotide amidohydrolase family protein n=1 Tax=Candidatus Corynebacterium avicola TaxID=2838527 RepID=A0A9D1UMS9_9CORY|nr:nicotinamide-nucleotide amidohydrolase family protein [Candidatus Corynebacterium avicola]
MADAPAERPEDVASEVVAAATRRGLTVATAESLTAGRIASTIADVPGASAVLRGGLVVYATDLKNLLAGVDADLLDRVGPVHPDVAAQLAQGAARVCGADLGVGVTGVAGPDAQDGHPVGEVYIAVCVAAQGERPGPGTTVHRLDDTWRARAGAVGTREAIREHTTLRALELLYVTGS